MFIDLKEYLAKIQMSLFFLIVVERLYPFPVSEIEALLNELPNLENVAWVQEEPKTKALGHLFIHI